MTGVQTCALPILAPAARADSIAAKRQEANRVYQEIVLSQQKLEGVIQKYDEATVQLHTTESAIRYNNLQLRRARHNLPAFLGRGLLYPTEPVELANTRSDELVHQLTETRCVQHQRPMRKLLRPPIKAAVPDEGLGIAQ